MQNFNRLNNPDNLSDIIKAAFDMQLDITGGYGYDRDSATIIHDLHHAPAAQFEHTFALMRAYLEMNMTLSKDERYGSINVNEIARERICEETYIYDKVTYEISAIKEDIYAQFIDEYKAGYETEAFDLTDHFNRRKEATLKRKVIHWFNRLDSN